MNQIDDGYGYSQAGFAGFTTYTNEEFGISFTYPRDWEIDEYPAYNEHEIIIKNEDGTASISINIYIVDNPFSKNQQEIDSAIEYFGEDEYTYNTEESNYLFADNPTTLIKYENSEYGIRGINYYGYDDYRAYNLSYEVDAELFRDYLSVANLIATSSRLSDISPDLITPPDDENCQRPPPQPCTQICAPLFSGGQHCWLSCPPPPSPDC